MANHGAACFEQPLKAGGALAAAKARVRELFAELLAVD